MIGTFEKETANSSSELSSLPNKKSSLLLLVLLSEELGSTSCEGSSSEELTTEPMPQPQNQHD